MSILLKRSKSNHRVWDFRVMAADRNDDACFEVHKMYYDDHGNENMYSTVPTSCRSHKPKDVASFLNILKSASKRPILWRGERFPEIYIQDF